MGIYNVSLVLNVEVEAKNRWDAADIAASYASDGSYNEAFQRDSVIEENSVELLVADEGDEDEYNTVNSLRRNGRV